MEDKQISKAMTYEQSSGKTANGAIHLTPHRGTPRACLAEPRRTSRATVRGR
jgi:hypothetical protein